MTQPATSKNIDSGSIQTEVLFTAKNSLIYSGGRLLSYSVGFLLIPVYTRFIAPRYYGSMELIEIIALCIGLIMYMGISDGMPRFYYAEKKEKDRNLVVSSIILGLAIIGIPIVLFAILTSKYFLHHFFEDSMSQLCFDIAIITLWFGMLSEVGYTYLRMLYRAKLFVVLNLTQLIIAITLNIWFVAFLKLNILGIFYTNLIIHGLTGTLLTLVILKEVRPRLSFFVLKKLVKFGLPLVPGQLGTFLGFVSNRFFLRWLSSPGPITGLAQVGLYSLGAKFGRMVDRFVGAPINAFWGPRRLELLLGGGSESGETIARVCTYATFCSVYFALILCSGIESIITFMADPSYKGAHLVVPFIAAAYVFFGLERHFNAGIILKRKTTLSTWIAVPALCVVLYWNYLFVPRFGLIGAATSNLAGLVVRCVLIYIVSQRLHPIPFEIGRIVKMVLIACIFFVFIQNVAFSSLFLTFMVRTGIAILFPIFLLPVGFYRKGETEFAARYLRKCLDTVISLGVRHERL